MKKVVLFLNKSLKWKKVVLFLNKSYILILIFVKSCLWYDAMYTWKYAMKKWLKMFYGVIKEH